MWMILTACWISLGVNSPSEPDTKAEISRGALTIKFFSADDKCSILLSIQMFILLLQKYNFLALTQW
jgi:hypothetical protein